MTATMPGANGTTELTAGDLRRLLADEIDVRLLDVRTPGEFAGGHIAGATNIPLDQVRSVAGELASAKGNTLVLICQAGSRANSARDILNGAGCANVSVLAGGMTAWSSAGGQVESRSGRWTLERQVRLAAGSMVFLGIAVSVAWPAARYFSGAVGGGLVFAAVTNTCAMGLLLGKLPYNRGRSCDIRAAVGGLTRS